MSSSYQSVPELVVLIGHRVRQTRLSENLTRQEVSERGGVSITAIRHLEDGKGATIETLVRVLIALDKQETIDQFLPSPGISPLQLFELGVPRKRARKKGSL